MRAGRFSRPHRLFRCFSVYRGYMSIWASDHRTGHVREALTLLLSQGVIDDFRIRPEDEFPFRVQFPTGIVPMTEHQAAHFALGATVAHFGDLARDKECF
ncbi:hypothetical protein GCM10028793_57870 [Nocardiopsis oceani]